MGDSPQPAFDPENNRRKFMSASFRTRTLAVTSAHFEALQVLAELNGCDCPDAYAETLLAEALAAKGQLDWLMRERRKQREDLRTAYADRLRTNPTL